MKAVEIQAFSQSIAFHPVMAIGGLMVLISIARDMDLNYKEVKNNTAPTKQTITERKTIPIQDQIVNDSSLSFKTDADNSNTSTNP